MKMVFSRRGFLKGAAAAALAVSMSGLLAGCSNDDAPSTSVVLGDYKVDVDIRKSLIQSETKNGKTISVCIPTVYITNMTGSVAELKMTTKVFQATASDGTELKFEASYAPITLVQKIPSTVTPRFSSTDSALQQKLNSGEQSLKLYITLSGQTAVYTMNFRTMTQTVEKV